MSYRVTPTFNATEAELDLLADALFQAMPAEHRDFFRLLRTSFSCGDYFFAHAGVRPRLPLDQQREEDLLSIREEFLQYKHDFGKIVVHGHTPVECPTFAQIASTSIPVPTPRASLPAWFWSEQEAVHLARQLCAVSGRARLLCSRKNSKIRRFASSHWPDQLSVPTPAATLPVKYSADVAWDRPIVLGQRKVDEFRGRSGLLEFLDFMNDMSPLGPVKPSTSCSTTSIPTNPKTTAGSSCIRT